MVDIREGDLIISAARRISSPVNWDGIFSTLGLVTATNCTIFSRCIALSIFATNKSSAMDG